jgi:hypothetical protein
MSSARFRAWEGESGSLPRHIIHPSYCTYTCTPSIGAESSREHFALSLNWEETLHLLKICSVRRCYRVTSRLRSQLSPVMQHPSSTSLVGEASAVTFRLNPSTTLPYCRAMIFHSCSCNEVHILIMLRHIPGQICPQWVDVTYSAVIPCQWLCFPNADRSITYMEQL